MRPSALRFLLCTLSPTFTVARQLCASGIARVIMLTLFGWLAAIPCLHAQTRALEASDLCNPKWWMNATGPSVQTLLRTGAGAAEPCSNSREGDYPLHLAAVFGNDAGAVQALVNAGANTRTPNGAGETPVVLFTRRYEQAVSNFGQASQTLTAMSAVFDRQLEAVGVAQNSLCSLEWWRNPIRPNAETAVKTPGIDLDASCDGQGNRPLHIALSLELFITEPQYNAITWLVYAGARNVPNRRGETPLTLAETRYQRTLIRWDNELVPQICRGLRGMGQQIGSELDTYYYLRPRFSGESREEIRARTRARLGSANC